MGIGSKLRSIGRKIDPVKNTKKVLQGGIDLVTGKAQHEEAVRQVQQANANAIIEAKNASQPIETKSTYSIDLEGTIAEAQAVGINPLTAIKYAGANTISTGTQVQYVEPLTYKAPIRNTATKLNSAFNTFTKFSNFKNNFVSTKLEQQYLRSQINSFGNNKTIINGGNILNNTKNNLQSKLSTTTSNDKILTSILPDYEFIQDPFTNKTVETDKGTVASENIALFRLVTDHRGETWRYPGDPEEMGPITGTIFAGVAEAYHRIKNKGLTYLNSPAGSQQKSKVKANQVNWYDETKSLFE